MVSLPTILTYTQTEHAKKSTCLFNAAKQCAYRL